MVIGAQLVITIRHSIFLEIPKRLKKPKRFKKPETLNPKPST